LESAVTRPLFCPFSKASTRAWRSITSTLGYDISRTNISFL
jgi:hypothetical protein